MLNVRSNPPGLLNDFKPSFNLGDNRKTLKSRLKGLDGVYKFNRGIVLAKAPKCYFTATGTQLVTHSEMTHLLGHPLSLVLFSYNTSHKQAHHESFD